MKATFWAKKGTAWGKLGKVKLGMGPQGPEVIGSASQKKQQKTVPKRAGQRKIFQAQKKPPPQTDSKKEKEDKQENEK